MTHDFRQGDCLELLRDVPDGSIDAVVTDPPYGISFMGKDWDRGIPGVPFWVEVLRVCKPGSYLLTLGGTRTYHRLASAVEDAGWQLRDCLMWLYGTGFPKGHGSLKPAYEPIVLARKPGPKVLSLNVDECRVACEGPSPSVARRLSSSRAGTHPGTPGMPDGTKRVITSRVTFETYCEPRRGEELGRYPANLVHDGSEELSEALGAASRLFYCAKPSRSERDLGLERSPPTLGRNAHPTVKPLALMRHLVRLVSFSGGLVLDPFAGSGTTGIACKLEGRRFLGMELSPEYCAIARERIAAAQPSPPE